MKSLWKWVINHLGLLGLGCLVLGLLWLVQHSNLGEAPLETAVTPDGAQRPGVIAATAQPAEHRAVLNRYGQLPLHFEQNQGQAAAEVQFLARGPGYTVFLTLREIIWTLRNRDALD